MNILILTKEKIGLGLAHRLAAEGNQVKVWGLKENDRTGELLYEKADNLWKAVQWCKFIIADSSDWTHIYDKAATYNKPVIGCNAIGDLLNKDCIIEHQLIQKFGLSVPHTVVYEDSTDMYAKVIDWAKIRYKIKMDRRIFKCDYRKVAVNQV